MGLEASILKNWRKWSYWIIWLICGVVILTATDSWSGVLEPGKRTGVRLASGIRPAGQGKEEADPGGDGEGDASDGDRQESEGEDVHAADAGEDGVSNNIGEDVSTGDGSQGENLPEEQPVIWRDPSQVVYTEVDDSYFSDAVFIGDSRTVGMFEYGGLEEIAAFYASTGLTVFKLFDSPVVEVPDQKDKITIEQALSEKQFAKIYLMIGINEMGRGDLQGFLDKYSEVIEHLKELQPDAIIYLQAIMKVTDKRSGQGDYITNEGIEERNQGIAALADNVRVFYLDVNPLICDDTGGMEPSYTTDGVHLKAQYIPIWKEFLKQHAVVLD